MVLTMTLGSKNRSNIMETIIVNLTIGIPIITIKEVSHGTDNHTGFEEPQQHNGNNNNKSFNRDSNHHDHRGISWY